MDEDVAAAGDGGSVAGSDGQWTVWNCRQCGTTLGAVYGARLHLSLFVIVERQVRVCCRQCGLWQTWYAPGSGGQGRLVEVKSLG